MGLAFDKWASLSILADPFSYGETGICVSYLQHKTCEPR